MNKKVKAKKGIKVFFPRGVMSAPGGAGFILEGSAVVTTDASQSFVHKRIKAGDLVEVKDVEPEPTPEPETEDTNNDGEDLENGY